MKLTPERYCLVCGAGCSQKRSHALYCSSACKQTAYQKRKEALLPKMQETVRASFNETVVETSETVTEQITLPEKETVTETINKNANVMQSENVENVNHEKFTIGNSYSYKRLPEFVKELNSHLSLWIDEFLKLDEYGFDLSGITDLIKKIKNILDVYQDNLEDYPHIEFINSELLHPLYDLLDMMLHDPEAEGRFSCSEEHLAVLKKKRYELI